MAMKTLHSRGGRLTLDAASPRVARMLAVTRLDSVFRVGRGGRSRGLGPLPDLLRNLGELDQNLFEFRLVLGVRHRGLSPFERLELRFEDESLSLEGGDLCIDR